MIDFLIGTAGGFASSIGAGAAPTLRPISESWTERMRVGRSASGSELLLT